MVSSGTTALATNSASVTTLLSVQSGAFYRHVAIVNEGDTMGFFSLDGGDSWCRLGTGSTILDDISIPSNGLLVMRDPATGSDLTGLFAFAY